MARWRKRRNNCVFSRVSPLQEVDGLRSDIRRIARLPLAHCNCRVSKSEACRNGRHASFSTRSGRLQPRYASERLPTIAPVAFVWQP
jgi:hypothetical protein